MNNRRLHFCVSIAVFCISVLASGCAVDVPRAEDEHVSSSVAAATVAVPTIAFDASWNETVIGSLSAGGSFTVDYDDKRLPNCRASHNGNPGWQITTFTQFSPSGLTVESNIFEHATKPSGEPDYFTWVHQLPKVQIPVGTTDVTMWVKNVSAFDHPCTEWDSDFGRNYHFKVEGAQVSGKLSFQSDWRSVKSGSVGRGGALTIEYARARMDAIAHAGTVKYHCYGYGCCSYDADIRAHVRFHGTGGFGSYPVSGDTVVLNVPGDASRVEVYFDADVQTTTWYCASEGQKFTQPTRDRFYDSNYGENFVFTIP